MPARSPRAHRFLKTCKLSKYGAALRSESVVELADLTELAEEEQDELAASVGMKSIERKRLRRHLQQARQRDQGRQQRAALQRTGRLKNRKSRLENCLTCSGAKTPD